MPSAVTAAAAAVGVLVTEEQARRLGEHAQRVIEANDQLNLTSIVDPNEVLWLQIVDSIAYLPLVGDLAPPVVDIGSGSGFPGIPLAICSGLVVTLCESTGKKARFLEEAVHQLVPTAVVYGGRAETLAELEPAHFGTAIARAVASTAALVELAAPLLRPGGRLLALKGEPDDGELELADATAVVCGMARVGLSRYALPERADRRCVVCYERVGEPLIALPRRPGMAQRRPAN